MNVQGRSLSGEAYAAERLRQAAELLPSPDTPEFAEAFDRFGDARIVMLGEATHGTHEFYAARAAITRPATPGLAKRAR